MELGYSNLSLCIWLIYFAIATLLVNRARPRIARPPSPESAPQVAVLLPVRGYGLAAEQFVDRLMAQDYPRFRVLLLVESDSDPALDLLRRPGMAERAIPVIAGETELGTQKVANLLAGVSHLTSEDEIVVFCDADSRLPANWLTRLTEPIRNGEAEVTSTFRLLIPKRPRLGSCHYSAIDCSVALAPRPPGPTLCWGGSTAVLTARLPELDLAKTWHGVYSDDLSLTKAVWAAKLKARYLPDLLLPTDIDMSFREARSYAIRQWMHFRFYLPIQALGIVIGVTAPFFFWTMATIRLLQGAALAPYIMIAVFVLDMIRFYLRRNAIRRLAGDEAAKRWTCAGLASWLLAVPRSFLIIEWAVAAYLRREITWAGIRYRIRGRHDVRVLSRTPPKRASTD